MDVLGALYCYQRDGLILSNNTMTTVQRIHHFGEIVRFALIFVNNVFTANKQHSCLIDIVEGEQQTVDDCSFMNLVVFYFDEVVS